MKPVPSPRPIRETTRRRPTSIARALGILLFSTWLSSCGLTSVSCTSIFVYGLSVTAVDADTGEPVTEGLQGVAIRAVPVQRSISSDMMVYENRLMGAGEQPGVYTVVVTATGYEIWTRTDVAVTADQCHVQTVELTAELLEATSD